MSFKFSNNIFNTTSASSTNCLCNSCCCKLTSTTTTKRTSPTCLCQTPLRRKVRKTSRRKRKRRRTGCSNNTSSKMNSIVNMDNITTSNKCKLSVNRKTKLHSYINNSRTFYSSQGRKCSSSSSFSSNSSKCRCSSGKKISLIVKNIVTLLLPTTTTTRTTRTTRTATKLVTATPIVEHIATNVYRKKVQLHLKQHQQLEHKELQEQHNYLHTLEKNSQITATKPCIKHATTQLALQQTITKAAPTSLSSSSAQATTYPALTTITAELDSASPLRLATILPKCKTVTSSIWHTLSWPHTRYSPASLPARLHADKSRCNNSSRITTNAARLLHELYGVIFMTLLVLSICHNNVLETSAASVKIIKRDVMGPQTTVAQVRTSSASLTAVGFSEKNRNQPEYRTEQILQLQEEQKIPQANNYRESPLQQVEEDSTSNHIFQPQIQPQSLPYHNQQQQQQQPYLTTQQTSFSHGMALETTYNHTFQSLSIIDGSLTVAVDNSPNLMAVEEQMLIAAAAAAAASAGGVAEDDGSNIVNHHYSHHLHSNNGLGYYDANVVDGNDMMPYSDTNSMPIFDFGMPRNITARTGHTEAVIKCRVDRLDDKSVSWIRKRDLHILTVATATYTSDKRFQVTESKDAREWTLHVKSPQARDSGIYECQVNTEPKMSMAFQLNVIEISPDAKAVISGPADLHFKVGSAIILTCIVHQPSVKDIGPIYWYRGEYMITPFDINDNTPEDDVAISAAAAALPGVTPMKSLTTTQNKVNILDAHHQDAFYAKGSGGGGGAAGSSVGAVVTDSEHMPQILTNEITQDFTQRIAMESQLGDTMKSRLRISNAQTSDTGNYTCQPTTASSASVMVHVINDENPAAMQKSGANSFHNNSSEQLMLLPLICAATRAVIVISSYSKHCGCWF